MKKLIILASGILAAFVVIAMLPWTTVSAGERGVVTQFGAFKGNVLEPGFHFLVPFRDSVHKMTVQQQSYDVENAQTYTKDGQIVEVQTTLIYHVDPAAVGELYRDVGEDFAAKIIKPVAQELIKNEFGKFVATEIPSKRLTIGDEIEPVIRERLAQNNIILDDFVYKNEDFADSYEQAIAAKQVEEQNALKAKNVTSQVEEITKQQKLAADAAAYKTQKEVEALKLGGDEYVRKLTAEAAKVQADAQLEFAKHWTGNVPQSVTIVSGDSKAPTIPFLPLK